MGFWSGTGKLAGASMRGITNTGIAVGKAGLFGSNKIGGQITKHTSNNLGMFGAAVGLGAAGGAITADVAKEDKGTGSLIGGGAALAASSLGGAGAVTSLAGGAMGVGAGVIGAAGAIGGSMIKMPNKNLGLHNLSEIKMKKAGILGIVVAATIGGVMSAEKKYEQGRMGVNDGMMRSATPMIPVAQPNTYDNAGAFNSNLGGASGDLVFAMHNNR